MTFFFLDITFHGRFFLWMERVPVPELQCEPDRARECSSCPFILCLSVLVSLKTHFKKRKLRESISVALKRVKRVSWYLWCRNCGPKDNAANVTKYETSLWKKNKHYIKKIFLPVSLFKWWNDKKKIIWLEVWQQKRIIRPEGENQMSSLHQSHVVERNMYKS